MFNPQQLNNPQFLLKRFPQPKKPGNENMNSNSEESESEYEEGEKKFEELSVKSSDINMSEFEVLKEQSKLFYALNIVMTKNLFIQTNLTDKIQINLPSFLNGKPSRMLPFDVDDYNYGYYFDNNGLITDHV